MTSLPRPRLILVVLVVAIVSKNWFLSQRQEAGTACSDDVVTLSETRNLKVDPCKVFSETYQEARDKFIEAARLHDNVEFHSYKVHQEYTTDVAILRGTIPGLVIHSSGLHGIEAYAGSAIQVAWLQSLAKEADNRSLIPTVALIHAVNPYGMANYRRVDQSNVDLNRNALHTWSDGGNDMKQDRNSELYQNFDESLFFLRRPPTYFDKIVGFLARAVFAICKHGYAKLKMAMVTGQYSIPEGLFFGGNQLQPSHSLLYDFMEKTFLPTVNITGPVTWIDVHTGLGKVQGMDTLLTFHAGADDCLRGKIAQHFVNASIQDNQVAKGYEWVLGTADGFYLKLFDDVTSEESPQPWFVAQEFGTINSIMVGRALVLENMAHQYYGQESQEKRQWSDLLRDAFYPHTTKFRKGVLQRGWTVLDQAVERRNE